jgi:hypothetical protein
VIDPPRQDALQYSATWWRSTGVFGVVASTTRQIALDLHRLTQARACGDDDFAARLPSVWAYAGDQYNPFDDR